MRKAASYAFLLLAAFVLKAEIIDRIAITVDRLVITESDLRRQISLAAFMNGEVADFSPKSRRAMAERLIEQALIRNEMKLTRYPQTESYEADASMEEARKKHPSVAAYVETLGKYRLDERDLREYLLWQLTLIRFTNSRFRVGLQVAPVEVEDYYAKNLAGKSKLTIEQATPQIEEALIGERLNKSLYAWLDEVRTRTRVEIREESFK